MKDEILIKYLLGEAEVEEVTLVESWLKDNGQNQQHLLALRNIWDQSQKLEKENSYNTEEQWQLLQSKIKGVSASSLVKPDSPAGRVIALNPIGRKRFNAWGWVAALLVLGLGCWVFFKNIFPTKSRADELILTATASPLTDTLSDGSIITLNHYSRLLAPLEFTGKTREVTLKQGEAFFKVEHLEKKPFLVHTGAVDVKVLGTSFNIKREGESMLIHVVTGKVQVDYKGQHLILQADQQVSISPTTVKLVSEKTESMLYNYYVTRQFVANNTRLEDLVNVLNEAYGVHIVFGRAALKDQRLTTVFVQQPIDRILDIIAATFNIQVIRKGDVITLQ